MNRLFYRFSAIFLFSISLYNCNNQNTGSTANDADSATGGETVSPHTIPVFEKLVGTWKLEDGKTFERWTRNDDGTYSSTVYILKGSDTSWNDQAHIYPENSQWIFENTVKGQNDGKSVKFTASKLTENSVQFSNPAHDFPTDINYTVSDQNTVNAFIIGPNNRGGKDTIPFNYKRLL